MNKKIISAVLIPTILILCLGIGLSGTVAGYQMSERSYQLVSACYTDHLIAGYGNVPEFRPDGTVIHRGIIETIPDEKGMGDWHYEMRQITNNTRTDMEEYFFPNGPVVTYGHDLLGTICVGIWKEADTVPQTRDDIYATIDAEAQNRGIKDVPVIFIRESMPDARALLIPTFSKTPYIRTLQETANGYPPAQAYIQNAHEKRFPSGVTHCSVAFLIEMITPGYWLCHVQKNYPDSQTTGR